MADPIYKNNDHRLRLEDVVDIDDNVLNAGTVTYSLTKVSDGTVLGSGSLPVQGVVGDYYATIDRTVTQNVEEDEVYEVVVVYTDGAGNQGEFSLELYGAIRRRR